MSSSEKVTPPVGGGVVALAVLVGVVGAVAAGSLARVEPGRGVLERQTHLRELELDLVDRLAAEVADVEEVRLAAADELADEVDAFALEAVVRADREVHLLDRQRQVGGELRVDRRGADVDALGLGVELVRQAEQADQSLAGRGHRVAGRDRRLGLDVDDEPVEVGALLDAGRLDLVGDLGDRGVDGVDRDAADLLTDLLVLDRADVAAAALDRELDLELALAVEGRDPQLGVVDLDAGGRCDVGGGDLTGSLLAQVHDGGLVVLARDDELLEVEDQVGDVLLHPGDGGELVQDAVDADARDGRAGDARQERAAERVAQGVAEARLERLDDEPRPVGVDRLLGQGGALCDEQGGAFSMSWTTAI